ncbi:MAG: carbonic anhydrase [Pseudomonadota bacterium]
MSEDLAALPKVEPLPTSLVKRYRSWRDTDLSENRRLFQRLADEGQRPRYMAIACADSRVQASQILGGAPGEVFMHRNIASLVPPCTPDGAHHGTSAAVEYAVQALQVTNLIVMGHSLCGGVKGCHEMCRGDAPSLEAQDSFVGRWIDILRPGYDRVKDLPDEAMRLRALEEQAVIVSLENLMTFPFVASAVEAGKLALHGLWIDISSGELRYLRPESGQFEPV